MKNLKIISPDYPRIPHLNKKISSMTWDDISLESELIFPFTCYIQEKIDGSNIGFSWNDRAPIVRNRNHILKKSYIEKNTPAKLQFRSAWNWCHDHKKDIETISRLCESDITIYGEWLVCLHSLNYDLLPDWFVAYDIYSVEDKKFFSPDFVEKLLLKTNISYIKPELKTFNNVEEIVKFSELKSNYRNGIREGIVLKTTSGNFLENIFKVVNKYFVRRENFMESILVKNKLI